MLYLSAIFLSFFLAFLLIAKKGKIQADYLLCIWLMLIGFHTLTFYLYFTSQYLTYPGVVVLGFSIPLLHGPFLYLYTLRQTSKDNLTLKHFLHLVPFIISVLVFGSFHFLPPEEKILVFVNKGEGYRLQTKLNLYAIYLSGVVYLVLSLVRLFKHRQNIVHQFSNIEKINFNWLFYLIVWMVGIWLIVLFIGGDQRIFAAVSCFVLWLGYFGIKQVPVFSKFDAQLSGHKTSSLLVSSSFDQLDGNTQNPVFNRNEESLNVKTEETAAKYQRSVLSEKDIAVIHQALTRLMEDKKIFTNPDLALTDLAKELDVHPNYLSQVINSKENNTFYDLINKKRVEEFVKLISNPENKQFTLLGLAFDCGFNSKASFNRNFKKFKGVTPSDFLKLQNIS